MAKEHFIQLEPDKFHTPLAGCTFFFKKKRWTVAQDPIFQRLLLVVTSKSQDRYFFTAQQGIFKDHTLMLQQGSIQTMKQGHFHTAIFDQMTIDLNDFVNKSNTPLSGLKFMTWKQLVDIKEDHLEAAVEVHKRFAQVVWQLILPLLALFIALMLHRYSLLASVASCGTLYLISHVLISLGQAMGQHFYLALSILYIPPALMLAGGLWLYKKLFI